MLYSVASNIPEIEPCKGWDATMSMFDEIANRFFSRHKNLNKIIYGDAGYISPTVEGKNTGGIAMYLLAKWLLMK